MQKEALTHHLNDLASLGAGQRRFEHRLMQLRIKLIPNRRVDFGNAVLVQNLDQFAQGQFQPLDQGGGLRAGFFVCGIAQSRFSIT